MSSLVSPIKQNAVDVAIIGSGFSGLCMAIQLRKSGVESFVVLEKEGDVGGTWLVNTYPGCACDVQSHLYSYSFEPNPDWSRMFASQPEIRAYLKRCAEKYGVMPKVRANSEVTGAEWDEAAGRWHVRLKDGAKFSARVLVSAIGGLSRAAYPQIKGLEKFAGAKFHSQQWDHSYDFAGKRVAVIGTGASAIQFVPQIAEQVAQLDLYQRTPPWILPKPDRPISQAERLLFRRLPAAQRAFRSAIYWQLEARALGFTVNPRLMKIAERWARSHLRRQVADKELRRKLTPDYTIGCKRILISDDYYPALARPNVAVLTAGIREVRERSVVDAQGVERQVDAIVFGTGFDVVNPLGPVKITGRDGVEIHQAWKNGPEAYLGTAVHGYPNLFMLLGPNTGLGHNSIIYMIEAQVGYVLEAILRLRGEQLHALEVRAQAQASFNEKVQAQHRRNVWTAGGCKSWYLDAQGRNFSLWPTFTWKFAHLARRFDPASYYLRTAPLLPMRKAA